MCGVAFDSADNEEARYQARVSINSQRTEDFKNGTYKLGGGVIDPSIEDAPDFVKQYSQYYKVRAYHPRSLNSLETKRLKKYVAPLCLLLTRKQALMCVRKYRMIRAGIRAQTRL